MLSCVLIVPAVLKAKANTLAEAMGWGPNSYSVPLSASSAEPASHWGLHTWATEDFVAMLRAAGEGEMPSDLVEAGYPAQDFAAVVAGLTASIRANAAGHFAAVCSGLGVQPVQATL